MRAFTYERANTPVEAAAVVARTPGAKFIAGGTNLLDLMKLQIETPTHLVDVNGLKLNTIEPTPEGGFRSAHLSVTPTSPPTSAFGATTVSCHGRCSPARPASCATRRRRQGTFSSAPAAPTFTTRLSLATNGNPAAAARPLTGSADSSASSG